MKKMLKSSLLVAAAAMALAGCSKSDIADEVRPESGIKSVRGFAAEIVSSRTTLNDAATRMKWTAGDRLGFYSDVTSDANVASSTYAEGDTNFTAEIDTKATKVYAYYPYNAGQNTTYGYTSVNLPIAQSQTQTQAGVLAGENVPMSAAATLAEGEKTVLSFTPAASLVAFDLYDAEDSGESVKSVTFTPAEVKINGNRYIDMTTGSATSSSPDGFYTSATVTLTTPYAVPVVKSADKGGYIYLAVTPKVYPNGGTFTVTTTENVYYTFTTDKSIDLSNVYAPAVMTMNLAKVRKPMKDFSGSYVVLVKNAQGYFALSSAPSGTRLSAVAFEYNGTDASVASSDAATVWTVAKNGNNYTFANGGKYLSWSADKAADISDTPYDLTISENADGTVYVRPAARQGSYLSKNNQAMYFAFYGNTGQNCNIYLVPAEYKLLPSITLGESAVQLAFDDETGPDIAVTVTDATTVTAAAYDDESGTTECDWLAASYADGKVSYIAETNTTDAVRTAYIVVTAANDNGTKKAVITVVQGFSGGVTYTLSNTFNAKTGIGSGYGVKTGVVPDNGVKWTVTFGQTTYVGTNSSNKGKCKLGTAYAKVGTPMGYTADQTQVVAVISESAMANIGKVVVSGDTDSNNPQKISLVYSVDNETYTLIGTQDYSKADGNAWEFTAVPSAYYAVVMQYGGTGYLRTNNLKIEYYTAQ